MGQFEQARQALLNPLDAHFDHLGIAGKLLSERDRGGVLGMGAANLDDIGPGLGLVIQCIVELLQRRQQAVGDFLGRSDVHRGRERVV